MTALNYQTKPKLLILTSSFPSAPEDETCGYIRDFARSLSSEFQVQVLAPPDEGALDWPADDFSLTRSSSLLPGSIDLFQATRDFNGVWNLGAWLAFVCSITLFCLKAFKLAAQSDVLCSHWLVPSGLVGALVARLTGKPHVVVEHSGALHLLSRIRGGRLLAGFIVSSAERVVVVSQDLKQRLLTLCPAASSKIEVISMGVSVCEPSDESSSNTGRLEIAGFAAKSDKPMILFIGRLTAVKGVDVLLGAMRGLAPARLVIAGDGEQRPYLEALAGELTVDATFLGQVDARERNQLLKASDAGVIPSRILPHGRTEGAPVVCLEAMAARCPVIASRVGGLAEIIVDGQNGLLFDAGDESALAEKLRLLIGNSGLSAELATNAMLTAAEHSWPRVGLRFAEIIKASLNKDDRVLDDQEPGRSFA